MSDYPQPDPTPPPLPVFNPINWPQVELPTGGGGGGGGFQGFQGIDGTSPLIPANVDLADPIRIGTDAGLVAQSFQAIAIGTNTAKNTQSTGAIAIGYEAGETTQGINGIAIGYQAGQGTQTQLAIAIGEFAGSELQGEQAVALGYWAGQTTQASQAIAIGTNAGGVNQQTSAVAIGTDAGNNNQGQYAVAIGHNAGYVNQTSGSVAIGFQAGQNSQQPVSIAMGYLAGETNQGNSAVSIGQQAGKLNQGQGSVAIGSAAAFDNQGQFSVAVGGQAGGVNMGLGSVIVGYSAAGTGTDLVAIGREAGVSSTGNNCIFIGKQAGLFSTASNSIALTATDLSLAVPESSAFYVDPVRNLTTSNTLYYDSSTKEITYGAAPGGSSAKEWSFLPTPAVGVWNAVNISQNGQNILASNGTVYLSQDSGSTFTPLPGAVGTSNILALSDDAQYIIIGTFQFPNFLLSTDFGVSFTSKSVGGDIFDICCSQSGQYIFVTVGNDVSVSTDFGATFSTPTPTGGTYQLSINCSYSGQYVMAGGGPGAVSNDYGSTWSLPGAEGFVSCSVSGDGKYMIGHGNGFNSSYSTDFGVSFQGFSLTGIMSAFDGIGENVIYCQFDPNIFIGSSYINTLNTIKNPPFNSSAHDWGGNFTKNGVASSSSGVFVLMNKNSNQQPLIYR